MPRSSVAQFHLPHCRARLTVQHIELEDYHDIVNALREGPSVPAHASFDVCWSHGGTFATACDEANRFQGVFRETEATLTWRARSTEARFETTSQTEQLFALVGHEDNGRFHDCQAGDYTP